MADVLLPTAPHDIAVRSLAPCAVGWTMQLLLSGIVTAQATALFSKRKAHLASRRFDTNLLSVAVGANLIAAAVSMWDITQWMTDQDRSMEGLFAYKMPDVVAPICIGLVDTIVQVFMAKRSYQLVRKSLLFAVLIGALILTSFAATAWITAEAAFFYAGKNDGSRLFIPTQIWLWSSVLVDLVITGVLTVHLSKMKQGFNRDTDNFLTSIIRVSFETCAGPLVLMSTSAIMYAATWQSATMWNLYASTSTWLPSVYMFSLIYCMEATYASRDKFESSRNSGFAAPSIEAQRIKVSIPPHSSLTSRPPIDPLRSWDAPRDWSTSLAEDGVRFGSKSDNKPPFATYTPFAEETSTRSPASGPTRAVSILVEKVTYVDTVHDAVSPPSNAL